MFRGKVLASHDDQNSATPISRSPPEPGAFPSLRNLPAVEIGLGGGRVRRIGQPAICCFIDSGRIAPTSKASTSTLIRDQHMDQLKEKRADQHFPLLSIASFLLAMSKVLFELLDECSTVLNLNRDEMTTLPNGMFDGLTKLEYRVLVRGAQEEG